MKQSILFSHNGVQVSESDLVIHGKKYRMDEIESFRLAESNTLSSLGILFMFIGLLLLIEEDSFFVFGGLLLIGGVLIRFAHDPAYSLFITISQVEKSVFASKDILILNKVLKALEIAKVDEPQKAQKFQPPFTASHS
jgi:uncharacterized membrane protein